jgi:hypothetical protein
MNYLDIVNKVLDRLRESNVATTSESDYSSLIASFVLSTKREVEAAWRWSSLQQTIAVATVQGTSSYSITGSGKRFTTIDVFDVTNETYLRPVSPIHGRRQVLTTDQQQPVRYFFSGTDSSGDTKVVLTPIPNAVYTINFDLIVPQTDSPADDAEIIMEEWPIILGAWAKAIDERGEDSGKTVANAMGQYNTATGDAIAMDVARSPTEDTWYV